MSTSGMFVPRWASPTGDTIRDVMAVRGIPEDGFAGLVGMSPAAAADLLAGRAPLEVSVAMALAGTLGSTVQFWMSRDGQYQEDLRRLRDEQAAEAVPVKDMVRRGWLPADDDWADRIRLLREFFDVSEDQDLADAARSLAAGVRLHRSSAHRLDDGALAAWLRRAEQVTADTRVGPWDPDALTDRLDVLRGLTRRRDICHALDEAGAVLADAGVRLAVVPTPAGCPVSGAARRDREGVWQVVLSGRHLSDDHIWFTFFHELGHLHPGDDGQVCADPTDPDGDPAEREANAFAERVLVPGEGLAGLHRRSTLRDVVGAASRLGVSPGIVLGQLQFRGVVAHGGRLERAKRRFEWDGDVLVPRAR